MKYFITNPPPWEQSFILPLTNDSLPKGIMPALMAEEKKKQELSKSSKPIHHILQDSMPEEVTFHRLILRNQF
jgi:hypothetical protein